MDEFQEIHIEKDFWDDFIVEAFEHIEAIENNAMSLEQNPEDMDIIHTMFRAFHTIKGLSGFVEHTIIQEIAHKTETVMDFCRKGTMKVNTQIVDAILKSSDYIKNLCEEVEAYKNPELQEKIKSLLVVLEDLANVEQAPAAPKEEPESQPQEQSEPPTTNEQLANETPQVDELFQTMAQEAAIENVEPAEPVAEPATEPAVEPVAEPTADPAPEAFFEAAEPVQEQVAEEKTRRRATFFPRRTTNN